MYMCVLGMCTYVIRVYVCIYVYVCIRVHVCICVYDLYMCTRAWKHVSIYVCTADRLSHSLTDAEQWLYHI